MSSSNLIGDGKERVIHKLDQSVINKICAGEVIIRPMNVVKELIENSLDAGATKIQVIINGGGFKSIIIQDNGHGIKKTDLPIVCQRFTTSKLYEFSDLFSLSSFGFRGEALASISTMANVTIISKRKDSVCGYRSIFEGETLRPGTNITPEAANDGTTIIVENLFYNFPTRRVKLVSESTELGLIHDMMIRYAIYYSGRCGFTLRKQNDKLPLVNTKESNTIMENICAFFGHNLKDSLIPFSADNERYKYKVNGFLSNTDLNLKKCHFILFINSRLVECGMLKRALKELYSTQLMKGGNPFILLMLEIDPANIDVNVHPTKNEVCFLHQTEISDQITKLALQTIKNISLQLYDHEDVDQISQITPASQSQSMIDYNSIPSSSRRETVSSNFRKDNSSPLSSIYPYIRPTEIKRLSQSKESFETIRKLRNSLSKKTDRKKTIRINTYKQRIAQYLMNRQKTIKKYRKFSFTSIRELRNEISLRLDKSLRQILERSEFVGCIREKYAMIQSEEALFLIDLEKINRELFYQVFLIDFGNFNYFKFRKSLSLYDLFITYFSNNKQLEDGSSIEDKIHNYYIKTLCAKSTMLNDFFSIKINIEDEVIEAMPILIDNHTPNWLYLPEFLHDLVVNVDWEEEKECFRTIGNELANFYSRTVLQIDHTGNEDWINFIQNKAYPLYKTLLTPTIGLNLQHTFSFVINTNRLYRVFERC